MKRRWIKDFCPFAKDQGFLSVIGDVAPGEILFGFSIVSTGAGQVVVFSTATSGKVHQMKDNRYRVQISKCSAGSIVTTEAFHYNQTKIGFTMDAESGQEYDVVVIGKVAY